MSGDIDSKEFGKLKRTVCACDECKAGCRAQPGYLLPSDLEHFDQDDLRASEGMTIFVMGRVIQLGTIVPAQKSNGECVFYKDGNCTVHEHSPYGCRMFSVCEPKELQVDFEQKQHYGVVEIAKDKDADGPYSSLRKKLLPAKPLKERKEAFHALLTEIEDDKS